MSAIELLGLGQLARADTSASRADGGAAAGPFRLGWGCCSHWWCSVSSRRSWAGALRTRT